MPFWFLFLTCFFFFFLSRFLALFLFGFRRLHLHPHPSTDGWGVWPVALWGEHQRGWRPGRLRGRGARRHRGRVVGRTAEGRRAELREQLQGVPARRAARGAGGRHGRARRAALHPRPRRPAPRARAAGLLHNAEILLPHLVSSLNQYAKEVVARSPDPKIAAAEVGARWSLGFTGSFAANHVCFLSLPVVLFLALRCNHLIS